MMNGFTTEMIQENIWGVAIFLNIYIYILFIDIISKP